MNDRLHCGEVASLSAVSDETLYGTSMPGAGAYHIRSERDRLGLSISVRAARGDGAVAVLSVLQEAEKSANILAGLGFNWRIPAASRENAMHRSMFTSAFAALALLWSTGLASAQSGTAAEAKAMLDSAAAALKANEAAALSAFNDKSNKQFHDRDLYVFCYNMTDGKFTAHPNTAMMGTDVRALKVKDDPLGQRIFDTIKSSSAGSVVTVDYNFPRPGTTDPVPKQSFVTMVGNEGCGVGYYK